jgi:hypothetical protein
VLLLPMPADFVLAGAHADSLVLTIADAVHWISWFSGHIHFLQRAWAVRAPTL